jgi:phospholipid:diacylglycerol acyltransferase
MGALLVHYFFAWVTASEKIGGGGGGKDWVDKHVHTLVNIAGSHLGVPKAATALLSGEMSETAFTGMMGNMAEQFFGRRLRRDLWSTWGSLFAMLPKGGSALWGTGADMCTTRSKDDDFCLEDEISPMIRVPRHVKPNEGVDTAFEKHNSVDNEDAVEILAKEFAAKENLNVEDIYSFLLGYGAGLGPHTAASRDFSLSGQERDSSRIWHDPTRTPLPHAPNMRIFCLYGVGLDTERAYSYRRSEDDTVAGPNHTPEPPVILDPNVKNGALNTSYGTRFVDGDGSVPLLSLGYMCADAWQRRETGLNPSRTKVITREYPHESEFCVDDPMRGGPGSAEHVDILGNIDLTEDFLRIVTGFEPEVVGQDRVVSDIKEIAARINAHPQGGVGKQQP